MSILLLQSIELGGELRKSVLVFNRTQIFEFQKLVFKLGHSAVLSLLFLGRLPDEKHYCPRLSTA
jgi:hypothetical protein